MDVTDTPSTTGPTTPDAARRIILVANRLPVTVAIEAGNLQVTPSVGGVATGLMGIHESGAGPWIGWPGEVPVRGTRQRQAITRALGERRLIPVYLSRQEVDRFYERYANGVLWPLFHYQIERLPLETRDFGAYRDVNVRYADLVAAEWRPGDLVWIHDYQLALVPALLRERVPAAAIGFFLHIPFPASEVFRILPQREEILRGMLGADLVGFHTFSYLGHFAAAARRILDLDAAVDRLIFDGREVRLGFFPMSVDATRVAELAAMPDVVAEAATLHRPGANETVIVGIDRLDYTKGLRRRFLAFESLLTRHPELRGRVRLVQIAVPSRTNVEAYAGFRRQVDELVGRINAAFSTADYVPIHYVGRAYDARGLAVLYRAADVLLVTPLRDGMNLVAKEFVVSRSDEEGVLVLSEFAGAASELGEAVLINPYDIEGTATAMLRAITMPAEERRERMRAMRSRVCVYDVRRWRDDFVRTLAAAASARAAQQKAGEARWHAAFQVVDQLSGPTPLVLLLDYDGTLVPFARTPEFATPDGALLDLLRRLAAAPLTQVHLVSGRPRADLERWFAHLPIHLHAEHGLWSRLTGTEWRALTTLPDTWKDRVRPVLEHVTAHTPGSRIEEKTAGFAWHYRLADAEFGALQARELRIHLSDLLATTPVEVLSGHCVVEVRPREANKGAVVRQITGSVDPGTVLAAFGDDRTDEDLFSALPENGVSVRVGPSAHSNAICRLADWREVRDVLRAVVGRRTEQVASG